MAGPLRGAGDQRYLPRFDDDEAIDWLLTPEDTIGVAPIEALLAGTVDITYVGPSPVINGFTRTGGADIRVLTGASRGGAARHE